MSSPSPSVAPQEGAPEESRSVSVELTPEELLPFAMKWHREGRLEGARKCYETLLQLEPDNANATHFLGVLLHRLGHQAEGLERLQRSLVLDPTVAPWYNNLGNVLLEHGRFEEAAAAYARSVGLAPEQVEVLNNLGVLYRRMGQPQQAESILLQAIARDASFVDAHNNLSTLYVGLGRFEEAFSHFADAIALSPQNAHTRHLLTAAYGKAGRMEEGLQACREWLALEPDDAHAQHFFAAYGGVQTPDRASDAFVQSEFDGFANSFDAKLAALDYRAPQWVGEAVARLLGAPTAQLRILDAGCGTGLCAPYLRPFAAQLVGVDLSANMLQRAEDKGGYDQLLQAELVAYLQDCVAAYDVIVSADTLCYFGRLEAAFLAAKNALRPGGHWVFTVEGHAADGGDYVLHSHGRYSHARAYLESALVQAGFEAAGLALTPVVLRHEGGKPVEGWLVCANLLGYDASGHSTEN